VRPGPGRDGLQPDLDRRLRAAAGTFRGLRERGRGKLLSFYAPAIQCVPQNELLIPGWSVLAMGKETGPRRSSLPRD